MKRINSGLATLFVLVMFIQTSYSQDTTNNIFGNGIKTIARDSSFKMKFSVRIQNRYEGTYIERQNTYTDKAYLRRARLKFDGHAFSPKLTYKIEYELVANEMLDAVVKWNPFGNFSIWYGQTKLPGNTERVISSQKLQFVDRSLLNVKYNIDRDRGVQLRHHFYLGKILMREMVAVSQGEGKNFDRSYDNTGHDYTGRIEVLPLGKFTNKGEYFGSDLSRENTPKLMVGGTYDYNEGAIRENGQRGKVLSEERNLETIFADMVFKYRGISLLSEYAFKFISDKSPEIYDETGTFTESFYIGQGINSQLGYLFKNYLELAFRYTMILPDKATRNNEITQHTIGLSRYISGHNLKVQSDVSYTQEDNKRDEYQYRLQVELSF